MGDNGENQHGESKERGDRVHYQNGRERSSRGGWQVELGLIGIREAGIVADLYPAAIIISAETKDSKASALEAAERHGLDDWRRENCQQKQGERREEEHR